MIRGAMQFTGLNFLQVLDLPADDFLAYVYFFVEEKEEEKRQIERFKKSGGHKTR